MKTGKNVREAISYIEKVNALARGDIVIEHSSPKCFVHCSRGKYRSRTFPELARAIARQWTDYILSDVASKGTFRTTEEESKEPSK